MFPSPRIAVRNIRFGAGGALVGRGKLEPGDAMEKVRQATWGAVFSEVAVNDITGEVRVRRLHGTFAVGRVLNQRTARSQAQGGMAWGLGLALTENMTHDRRDGHIVNRDLAEYHVPVNADVPHLDVDFLDDADPWAGPLAAKGIGELGMRIGFGHPKCDTSRLRCEGPRASCYPGPGLGRADLICSGRFRFLFGTAWNSSASLPVWAVRGVNH